MKLPISMQIRWVDNTEYELYGIMVHKIQEKLNDKDFTDYPLLFLDGHLHEGGQCASVLKTFMKEYLKDDTSIEI